ncbi:hypothetical protein SNE40_008905 [Patella caerulea]|uniref:Ribokinase n=1 Tax=Patella caerulea TaxID=87958 RepID=A0AAN8PPC7_PATCE
MSDDKSIDVVVVGSSIIDLISYTQRQPKPGETIKGSKFCKGFGGKGANQCVMARYMGAECVMVSKLGKDDFGNEYMKNFKDIGMITDYVKQTAEASTATAAITVSEDGQNCIVIVTGACDLISEADLQAAESVIQKSKVMICQLEINVNISLFAMKMAKKHGVKTIFNSAPAECDIDPEFYTVCDIFCANETEAEILTGLNVVSLDDGKKAVTALLDKGCSTVILTFGEHGSLYATAKDRNIVHVPSFPVVPVDTTGAGDAFLGSLAYYVACRPDISILEAIKRSNRVAAITVQYPGTQLSYKKRNELPKELFE